MRTGSLLQQWKHESRCDAELFTNNQIQATHPATYAAMRAWMAWTSGRRHGDGFLDPDCVVEAQAAQRVEGIGCDGFLRSTVYWQSDERFTRATL